DDDLYTAMALFDKKGIEEIPVVESEKERWVVGMLKRRDVLAAYNREVVKKGISSKVPIPLP
ncbi:MAG: CBS domain-containing protein, partial [Deltaproteobacteria bacterium]|nr:CBS domain-containing protein [Deltaproteobacteria bacterium]